MDSFSLTITSERPDSADALSLIQQLDEDLLRRYPEMPAHLIHGLVDSDLADPSFTFIVARIAGRPVGCGALRSLEPGVAEVKRMYVQPEFRRRGIARRILSVLESTALELSCATLRLETGKGQPEAISLYTCSGYREIAAFGEYDSRYSICLEKLLHQAIDSP